MAQVWLGTGSSLGLGRAMVEGGLEYADWTEVALL